MGYTCFVCGKGINDNQTYYTIVADCGDIINAIHISCYDNDNRDYLEVCNKCGKAEELFQHKRGLM